MLGSLFVSNTFSKYIRTDALTHSPVESAGTGFSDREPLYIQKGTTIGLYTLGCVGWNRTTDLQLMRLASCHCYYLAICKWSTKCGDRTFLLFLFGKILQKPEIRVSYGTS